jgi:uncharacterized OB-fold protein
VSSGDREAPYTLAYVDLVDGPRVPTHVLDGFELVARVGERVRLVDLTEHGDPQVEVIR